MFNKYILKKIPKDKPQKVLKRYASSSSHKAQEKYIPEQETMGLVQENRNKAQFIMDKGVRGLKQREFLKIKNLKSTLRDTDLWESPPYEKAIVQFSEIEPHPFLNIQFASVVITTTEHTLKSRHYTDLEKFQIIFFVNRLLHDYQNPSKWSWYFANAVANSCSDRFGLSSAISGFAHTADFQDALLYAEKKSGKSVDPLAWITSFSPIREVLDNNYIPNLALDIGNTSNLFTLGLKLQPKFPIIREERNRQFMRYLLQGQHTLDIQYFKELMRDQGPHAANREKDVMEEVRQYGIPALRTSIDMAKSKAIIPEWYM